MAVRLTFLRHGPTDFNDEDRLRGWMDPPLNHAGKQMAVEAAKHWKHWQGPIFSSDLLRAVQTAYCIRQTRIQLTPSLRPWNVGIFAGRPGKLVHPILETYSRYPEYEVPFGENFNSFVHRYIGFLRSLREDCVLVTHFRNCKYAQAWAAAGYGSDIDRQVFCKNDFGTADFLELTVP